VRRRQGQARCARRRWRPSCRLPIRWRRQDPRPATICRQRRCFRDPATGAHQPARIEFAALRDRMQPPGALAADKTGRSARSSVNIFSIFHSVVVRPASRSNARLRLLRGRRSVAVSYVAGTWTERDPFRGFGVHLPAFHNSVAVARSVTTSSCPSALTSLCGRNQNPYRKFSRTLLQYGPLPHSGLDTVQVPLRLRFARATETGFTPTHPGVLPCAGISRLRSKAPIRLQTMRRCRIPMIRNPMLPVR
jgi:hypothetical protein